MKVNCCDVCYYASIRDGMSKMVLRRSTHKITHKNRSGIEKIQLDVCQEHLDFFKGNTYEQNVKKVEELYFAAPHGLTKVEGGNA